MAARIASLAEIHGASFVLELSLVAGRCFYAMMKTVSDGKTVFVSRVGSWFVGDLYTVILAEQESKWFPADVSQEPRYLQMQGGKHWYVKVGQFDVVVDGEQKWNTLPEAKTAYSKWKEENS